jgi:hypothetical protein
MKKQTAVDWLVQEIEKQCPQIYITWKENLIHQAKAMEKQQIADAYDYEVDANMHDYSSGEQYYNQTFK